MLFVLSISVYAQIEDIPRAKKTAEKAVEQKPEAEIPAQTPQLDSVTSAIVEIDPVAMLYGKLMANGRAVIQGIYFKSGKSDLKIESDSTLATIARLMKDHPSLRIYIVGHTDNTGNMFANMVLSQKRAESVMNSLADRFEIDLDRMFASGVGPLSPLASNETEEGRQQNNRIELVVQ